ncbi:MAG: branched-chain amino acid ABC transporter permease [Acidimicrobiales bacterium]
MIKMQRPWILGLGAVSLIVLGLSVIHLLNKVTAGYWPYLGILSVIGLGTATALAQRSGEPVLVVNEGSRAHRTWQTAGWGVFAFFVVATPYLLDSFRVQQVNKSLYYAVAVLGVNLIIGYSGLISLGHGAFMGVGAFMAVILVEDYGFKLWQTLFVIVPLAFVIGVIVGIPALRIKGLYLALVTFALSFAFPIILKIEGIDKRTGGDLGRNISLDKQVQPGRLKGILGLNGLDAPAQEQIYKYWLMVLVVGISFLLVRNIIKSRAGRAVIAIKENQIGAAVSGVPLTTYKVITFGISAVFAAVGGWLYALLFSEANPNSFGPLLAIALLLALVLGGVYTLQGALVGSLLYVFLDDLRTRVTLTSVAGWRPSFFQIAEGSPLTQAVLGLALILIAFFAPGGVVSLARKVRASLIRVVPTIPTADAVASANVDSPVNEPEVAPTH